MCVDGSSSSNATRTLHRFLFSYGEKDFKGARAMCLMAYRARNRPEPIEDYRGVVDNAKCDQAGEHFKGDSVAGELLEILPRGLVRSYVNGQVPQRKI